MPEELDPAVAENLVSGAMAFLPLTGGSKVLCMKRQLRECLLTLAQEAYAMGFLSGQKEQFGSLVLAGAAERPAWMGIRLDDLAQGGPRLSQLALALVGQRQEIEGVAILAARLPGLFQRRRGIAEKQQCYGKGAGC